MSYAIIVKPKKGNFLKNYDTLNKMDPYLKVSLGENIQQSDVASGQGKTPVWTKVLTFPITATQYNSVNDLTLLFEAFDDDLGNDEFIGKFAARIGQLKTRLGESNTLTLYDKKNASVGTIDVEIELKPPVQAAQPQNISPQKSNVQTGGPKRVVGIVTVMPVSAKFDSSSGINDNQKLYLILSQGDISYQSNVGEGSGRRPNFQDVFSFQHFENEELVIRVFDNDPRKEDMVAEGHVNLRDVGRRGGFVHGHIVPLTDVSRRPLGELTIDLEFFNDIVNNPIKAYPIVNVRRGETLSKKIKYDNPDKVRKTLRIKSDNPNIVFVKTENLVVNPGDYGEIRIKFLAPANSRNPEETCRIDVTVEETRKVEESLLFKVKAI